MYIILKILTNYEISHKFRIQKLLQLNRDLLTYLDMSSTSRLTDSGLLRAWDSLEFDIMANMQKKD